MDFNAAHSIKKLGYIVTLSLYNTLSAHLNAVLISSLHKSI